MRASELLQDIPLLVHLCSRGCILCIDGIGCGGTFLPEPGVTFPGDDRIALCILALAQAGFLSQVVLSHGYTYKMHLMCVKRVSVRLECVHRVREKERARRLITSTREEQQGEEGAPAGLERRETGGGRTLAHWNRTKGRHSVTLWECCLDNTHQRRATAEACCRGAILTRTSECAPK